jgi:hypothetical protein
VVRGFLGDCFGDWSAVVFKKCENGFFKNVNKTKGRAIYKIGKKVEFLPKLYFLKQAISK